MNRIARFVSELKRRNVFRAGAAYLVLAWLTIQIADVLLNAFESPSWVIQSIVAAVAIGFPVTLVLAWVFEITTAGIKRTEDVELGESITANTGRKLDFIVIGILSVAVAMFAVDRFVVNKSDKNDASSSDNFSIAVLPISLKSDQIAPFFGALSSDMARLLRRSSQLRVASVDAINALRNDSSLADSATQLGVRYLVSGALSGNGDDALLSISLYDSDVEADVWAAELNDPHLQETVNTLTEGIFHHLGIKPTSLPLSSRNPDAYKHYLNARQYYAADALSEDAERLFREVVNLDQRFSPALAGLCDFLAHRYVELESSRDFEEAERLCHRAWTIDSDSEEVQRALGRLFTASGQVSRARESYAAALALNPNSLETQIALAATYIDDQPVLAEEQLNKIILQHPGSPNAYNNLGAILYSQGRYEESVEPLRWAVRLLPGSERASIRLSTALIMAGMFDEGESLLRAMLRDDSLRTGSVENNLATVLYIQGQYDAAAELHQAAIDREPTDSLFYRNLGDDLWHMSGDADAEPVFIRAIEVAEQQLNINPNEELALSALMVAYASIGDSTSFERAKERVLDLYATNPYTHFDIAVGAARLEDLDTARIHTEKARELGYPEALLKADPDINLGE